MNKKIYLLMFVLFFVSPFLVSSQFLDYPYYMDVNSSELITIDCPSNGSVNSVYLVFENSVFNMSYDSNDNFFYSYVTDSVEGDVLFEIFVVNDSEYEYYNNSDWSSEDTLVVSDDYFYVFESSEEKNLVNSTVGNYEICANFRADTSLNWRFVTGLRINDSNSITWYYGDVYNTVNLNYATRCDFINYVYPSGNYNVTEYSGIQCINCGVKKLTLSVDTNGVQYDASSIFSNESYDGKSNFTDGNFIMSVIDFENNVIYEEEGVMRWRIPFYLNIQLMKKSTINSSDFFSDTETDNYCNEFQYIYLQFADDDDGYSLGLNSMSYLDSWFSWMPYYKNSFDDDDLDDTLSFWAKYDECSAIVKLYESGNYTVTLLSSDVMGLSWSEEFIYPQYKDALSKSKIVTDSDPLIITLETDTLVTIFASLYEVNKFNFVSNLAFNMLIIFGSIFIIVVSFMASDYRLAIILIPIWITFMKLLGVVIL